MREAFFYVSNDMAFLIPNKRRNKPPITRGLFTTTTRILSRLSQHRLYDTQQMSSTTNNTATKNRAGRIQQANNPAANATTNFSRPSLRRRRRILNPPFLCLLTEYAGMQLACQSLEK